MATRTKRYWLFVHPKEYNNMYAGIQSFLAAYNTFAAAVDEGKKHTECHFHIIDTNYGLIWKDDDLNTAKQLMNMF